MALNNFSFLVEIKLLKKCKYCQGDFESRGTSHVFCGEECKRLFRSASSRDNKKCRFCGKSLNSYQKGITCYSCISKYGLVKGEY